MLPHSSLWLGYKGQRLVIDDSSRSRASQGDKHFLQSVLDVEEILQIIYSNPVHFLILQIRKSRMIREGKDILKSQSFYVSFLSIFLCKALFLRQDNGTGPFAECNPCTWTHTSA